MSSSPPGNTGLPSMPGTPRPSRPMGRTATTEGSIFSAALRKLAERVSASRWASAGLAPARLTARMSSHLPNARVRRERQDMEVAPSACSIAFRRVLTR